jgi:aminoglycoside phosphotransferase (APT) family kinase protein
MALSSVQQEVEPAAVLDALGVECVGVPRRLTGGWDTLLWRFRSPDGRQHVLRIHYLPLRDELAARERAALNACASSSVPAPRVELTGSFEGLPALVLSWCEGAPMLSVVERRPWRIWRLARQFGCTQALIHRLEPPHEFKAHAPDDWIERAGERYSDLARHVAALKPSASALVHLDYHPLNVIVGSDGISGVIDWTYAAAGDPRADLARTEFTLRAAPIPPGPLRPALSLARSIVIAGWRSGYRQAAGGVPAYRPFMAWAGATLVAEVERVVDRPEVWGTQHDLEVLRQMVELWAVRTGIRPERRSGSGGTSS